ncbi:unnamed protein product [Blepharisma stoltei]|uniref:Uncharacterized protein n=1 Tax=Blepharisma stoltei TaxID=1481888 RepID=A0AAU9KFG7_9CILI|nr:unnamed protein product [Blepharisma stoltei]
MLKAVLKNFGSLVNTKKTVKSPAKKLVNPWEPKPLREKPSQVNVYSPSKILEFDESGSLLVYSYQPTFMKTMGRFLGRLTTTIGSFFLLAKNPWPFNQEPLCLPVFLFYGVYSLWRNWAILAHQSITIHEVKLNRDGIHIDIGYLSWLGRRSKKYFYTMPINFLTPPIKYEDSIRLKDDLFPTEVSYFEIPDDAKNKPWVKYYQEERHRLYIPKDYEFMDKELMVQIMKGKFINTTNK